MTGDGDEEPKKVDDEPQKVDEEPKKVLGALHLQKKGSSSPKKVLGLFMAMEMTSPKKF